MGHILISTAAGMEREITVVLLLLTARYEKSLMFGRKKSLKATSAVA
jgi:hypothetical protein